MPQTSLVRDIGLSGAVPNSDAAVPSNLVEIAVQNIHDDNYADDIIDKEPAREGWVWGQVFANIGVDKKFENCSILIIIYNCV